MSAENENQICSIFFRSFQIPAGIFSADRKLTGLYAQFGERQTRSYLLDAASLLNMERPVRSGCFEYDENGSSWCIITEADRYILLGPVQTGMNAAFSYESIPEYTRQGFLGIAKSFVWLILGEGAPFEEKLNRYEQKRIASYMYNEENETLLGFDEIFECVKNGDVQTLDRLMRSGGFRAYQDRILTDPETARNVYTFNLAKTYHTALESSVPISELSPLVNLYLRERDQYTSISALKSGMQRMIYDFARYVHQYSENYYSPTVNMTLMYIKEHIYEDIRVQDIADHCNLSKSSLQHRFREETGESISERILSLKMEKACYFLRNTSLSCADISYRLGYGSQSWFIQQFRKAVHMTPMQYRSAIPSQKESYKGPCSSHDPH